MKKTELKIRITPQLKALVAKTAEERSLTMSALTIVALNKEVSVPCNVPQKNHHCTTGAVSQ